MRMMWKPFKAVAQQRKKKPSDKSMKKMWEFMDNMYKAEELLQLCMDEEDSAEVYEEYEDLPSDFKLYVWAKCDHEKHKKPLSKGGTTTRSNLKAVPASANRSYKRKADGSIK